MMSPRVFHEPPTAVLRHLTHDFGNRPAHARDLHDLAVSVERDELTVGRPEHRRNDLRHFRLGADERSHLWRVEASDPQPDHPVSAERLQRRDAGRQARSKIVPTLTTQRQREYRSALAAEARPGAARSGWQSSRPRTVPTHARQRNAQGIHCSRPLEAMALPSAGSTARSQSPRSRRRRRGSFSRNVRSARTTAPEGRLQVSLPSRARAQAARRSCRSTVDARKRRTSGEHLEQHAAKRPDVSALVHDLSTCLFRAHVSSGTRAKYPGSRFVDRDEPGHSGNVGSARQRGPERATVSLLARPKSSTLIVPADVTLTFEGLRSR